MSAIQVCGAIGVMMVIVVIGVLSGRNVKDVKEFESGGGRSGCIMVSGMMIGAMVGGSSTIGTAQMAYSDGMFAWWYTLGLGLGCLVLGIWFTKPFRRTEEETLIGIIRNEYGKEVDIAISVFISLAWCLSLAAQMLSASAVLPFIFPGISLTVGILLAAGLMMAYVVFGGALGAAKIGEIKTFLLYVAVLSGVVVIARTTGLSALWETLDHSRYFDMFSRGAATGLGKVGAVILGVTTGQCYMQTIRMGSSNRVTRKGLLVSAVLIPLIGVGSILIGMFMQVTSPGFADTKNVFPLFALTWLPDWLSGIVMGTLMLAIIGSGAAGAMAAGVTVSEDIIQTITKRFADPKDALKLTRFCIVLILAVGGLLCMGSLGDLILDFIYLSSGTMASAMFAPLLCALAFPGKIDGRWVLAGVLVGSTLAAVFGFWPVLPVDSTTAGILGNLFCCAMGAVSRKFRKKQLAE